MVGCALISHISLRRRSVSKIDIPIVKKVSDIERILAFDKIGLKDPIKYKYVWKDVLEYAKKTKNEFKRLN